MASKWTPTTERPGKDFNHDKKVARTIARKEKSGGRLVVTEHAIMRFAKRVHGFDARTVEKKIRGTLDKAVQALGNGKYPLFNNMSAVVKDGAVVTIISNEEPLHAPKPSQPPRRHGKV